MSEFGKYAPPCKPIHVDDVPWIGWVDPYTGEEDPHTLSKILIDPASRSSAALVRLEPGRKAVSHWHLSDTFYVIRSGELHIEGEGIYRPGDVRWVMGGTPYNPEQAGTEPMEMYVISCGPPGRFDADRVPAPRGM